MLRARQETPPHNPRLRTPEPIREVVLSSVTDEPIQMNHTRKKREMVRSAEGNALTPEFRMYRMQNQYPVSSNGTEGCLGLYPEDAPLSADCRPQA